MIKEWAAKEWSGIYATQYRLFLVDDRFYNKRSIEVPYTNITSLEFTKKRPKERVIASMICMVLYVFISMVSSNILPYSVIIGRNSVSMLANVLLVLSIGLFAWFIIGNDSLEIYIAGRKSVSVSKELVELYYFARLNMSRSSHFKDQTDSTSSLYTPENIVRTT
ncbi:hypothetical protein JXL21_14120 [Candidatus Bathyarchaeota archaeon]|nr:hypothetical protein [Candidatus Bathyarchaeota archaeon]